MRLLAYENIADYAEREKSISALMDLLVYKLHDSSVDAGAAHVDSKLVRLRSVLSTKNIHTGTPDTISTL